jgi:hypothetical protein
MFCKVSLVGDTAFDLFTRIEGSFIENIQKVETGEQWDVVSFRLSSDNTLVEHFEVVGSGYRISDDHVAVLLNDKSQFFHLRERLTSFDSDLKRALVFVHKNYNLIAKEFIQNPLTKVDLDRELGDEVISSGLIFFLEESGFNSLATSCSCKGFFGGTSGCSSASCTVVVGFCQSNENCKSTDKWTSCSCRSND